MLFSCSSNNFVLTILRALSSIKTRLRKDLPDLEAQHIKIVNKILLFSQVSKIDASVGGGIKPTVKGDVEFSNIDFAYPSRPDTQVSEIITFFVVKQLLLVPISGS